MYIYICIYIYICNVNLTHTHTYIYIYIYIYICSFLCERVAGVGRLAAGGEPGELIALEKRAYHQDMCLWGAPQMFHSDMIDDVMRHYRAIFLGLGFRV